MNRLPETLLDSEMKASIGKRYDAEIKDVLAIANMHSNSLEQKSDDQKMLRMMPGVIHDLQRPPVSPGIRDLALTLFQHKPESGFSSSSLIYPEDDKIRDFLTIPSSEWALPEQFPTLNFDLKHPLPRSSLWRVNLGKPLNQNIFPGLEWKLQNSPSPSSGPHPLPFYNLPPPDWLPIDSPTQPKRGSIVFTNQTGRPTLSVEVDLVQAPHLGLLLVAGHYALALIRDSVASPKKKCIRQMNACIQNLQDAQNENWQALSVWQHPLTDYPELIQIRKYSRPSPASSR